jgi:hypothetical protein
MIVFVKLLLAYLLSDFIIQPNHWKNNKQLRKFKRVFLYIHPLIHIFLSWIVIFKSDFIGFAIAIGFFHFGIDILKLNTKGLKNKNIGKALYQLLYIIVIFLATILYSKTTLPTIYLNSEFWIILTAIVLLTKPTSIGIKNMISIWSPENKSNEDSLQNAGNYIGILERFFVLGFIVTNHFEAIGFLLAAKSIFRFGDLKEAKDRKLTEYVLIGTLLSFGIAMIVGLLVHLGITHSF